MPSPEAQPHQDYTDMLAFARRYNHLISVGLQDTADELEQYVDVEYTRRGYTGAATKHMFRWALDDIVLEPLDASIRSDDA